MYTWWNNQHGQDVMFYRPGVKGRYRLWISWGAHGSGIHTRDARYILDLDGDLKTEKDQRELAKVDQYYPANVAEVETEEKPIWSGFLDVGPVELQEQSVILLRGGETGTGITADVIALQAVAESNGSKATPTSFAQPRLRDPVTFDKNIERLSPICARFVRFQVFETNSNSFREPCIDELEVFTSGPQSRNIALSSDGSIASSSGNYGNGTGIHQLAHVNDGKYGNSHSWISNETGKGWVQIEFPKEAVIDRIVWARDRLGKFKDRLAIKYQIQASIDGTSWHTVASHQDRAPFGSPSDPTMTTRRLLGKKAGAEVRKQVVALQQLKARKNQLEKKTMVYAGKFRRPDESFVLRRGNPESRGESVNPAIPKMFGTPLEIDNVANEQSRRVALAKWIASPGNPLTARVMVNRVWSYHFGQGLVETPSDLGVNSTPPSHPVLLDWLAHKFVSDGWSLKRLHELIVTSQTYQQQSKVIENARSIDGSNRLYWRFSTRRLEAEAIRDSILAITGELNLRMGGPGFNFFKTRGGLSGFPPVTDFGREEFRRMVYSHKVRMEPVPVFGAFDCPDAGQATPFRSRSTTAIQALNLFNSPFMIERAEQFARRVRKEIGAENIEAQVDYSFELALGRLPSGIERLASSRLVEKHGLTELARVLFSSNEFLFLP